MYPLPLPKFDWTEERVTELRGHVEAGLSGGAIAQRFGISRNAVIGKIHRLGFRGRRPKPGPKPEQGPWIAEGISRRQWQRRQAAAQGRGVPQAQHKYRRIWNGPNALEAVQTGREATDLKPEVVADPIPLIDLCAHHCRWPVEREGEPMLYCGADNHGTPYCERHCRMAYVRPRAHTNTYYYHGEGRPSVYRHNGRWQAHAV